MDHMNEQPQQPRGIGGLTGREPIGAVLTIGHKGPKGNPTDTDRLFIVQPQEEDGIRKPHPAFVGFNTADADKRKSIRGILVHSSRAECFEHHLKAQVLPGLAHPNKRPACVGDGTHAVRWGKNGLDDFRSIPCPNEKCEFRQRVGDKPVPCKPWMRFLFRPVWAQGSPLPAPLMKYTSGAWNTTSAFLGFFEYIEKQAAALGVTNYTLYGLPFVMTLAKKKRRGDEGGRAFPILSISPEGDLQAFLWAQHERIRAFRESGLARPGQAVAALTDREQHADDVVEADYRTVNPGRGPVATPGVGDDDSEVP
jgi:hypothetical protein